LEAAANSDTCVPYEGEPTMHRLFRLGMYVQPSGPYHVAGIDIQKEIGDFGSLHVYGLGLQAVYGDAFTDAPSWIYFVDRMKWNAWDELKGMPKHKAAEEWVQIIGDMLLEYGHKQYLPDPQ